MASVCLNARREILAWCETLKELYMPLGRLKMKQKLTRITEYCY
jgi:hypothetical protein